MVLVVGSLLSALVADAQIVHTKPSQVKAANRRALREAQRADSPYKDSHLTITPARLRRGESNQLRPDDTEELDYDNGIIPNAEPPRAHGRRKKKQ